MAATVQALGRLVLESVGEGSTEERLKAAFSRIDKDNSGNISSDELRDYIRSVGGALSDSDIDAAMKEIDKDGNGDVSFEEFRQVFTA